MRCLSKNFTPESSGYVLVINYFKATETDNYHFVGFGEKKPKTTAVIFILVSFLRIKSQREEEYV